MSTTFQELQAKLTTARSRREILNYIIDHLDAEFRTNAGVPPKKTMLLEEVKTAIPEDSFEDVVEGILLPLVEEQEKIIAEVLATQLQPPAPAEAPAEATKKTAKKIAKKSE